MIDRDYLQSLGVSALGTRMRRLFEALNSSVSEIYRSEIDFEQRWFALTLLLSEYSPMSVQEAADALGSSHVSIIQMAKAMEARGLLERQKSPKDRRVALLALTVQGHAITDKVRQISDQVDRAACALLSEASPEFLDNLTSLENALRDRPFVTRLDAARNHEKETL